MGAIVHFVLLAVSLHGVRTQPKSKCPQVYNYTTSDAQEWTAEIGVTSETSIYGVTLDVNLDKPADTLLNWFGQSVSQDNRLFTISDEERLLKEADTLIVKILVRFNETRVPEIEWIRLNGKLICGRPTTTTTTGGGPSTTNRPSTSGGPSTSDGRQVPKGQETIKRLSGDVSLHVECGKIPLRGQPFIRKGSNTSIDYWPWHTAIYQFNGTDSSFLCGGTLISRDYVLTAAHCVTELYTETPRPHRELLLYLGTSNLRHLGRNVQVHQLSAIHVHPSYNGTTFYNDIAIVRLRYAAQYNENIWPVCLWTDADVHVESYFGAFGTVVGWGRDETNELSLALLKLNLPIVSLSDCLRSDRLFFATYLTENNYCAGYTNGSSVCGGDSGGGMVFRRRDKPDAWHLRGIVSVGALLPGTFYCHPAHYTIFTDVAKYLDWIQGVTGVGR